MKRFVLSMLCLAISPAANASPELAQIWAAKAGDLYLQTTENLQIATRTGSQPLNPGYVVELERFAYTAAQLSAWNDAKGGAKDFGCIFRGMAEDVEVQLDTLTEDPSAKNKVTAYKRLAALLDDAQQIGPAAASATIHRRPSAEPITACPANPRLRIMD